MILHKLKHHLRYQVGAIRIPCRQAGPWALRRLYRQRPEPLLVYQMGKVASKAVAAALRDSPYERRIIHVHFLTAENVERAMNKRADYRRRHAAIAIKDCVAFEEYPHLVRAKLLGEYLTAHPRLKRRIITLVRDPVATMLSHSFESVEISRPFLLNDRGEVDYDAMVDYLCGEVKHFEQGAIAYQGRWFAEEFRNFTGIDVFARSFDRDAGWTCIREGAHEILIIQTEALKSRFADAYRAFSGREAPLRTTMVNARESLPHAELYKQIKREIHFPGEDLRRLYASSHARHFFSDAFIADRIDYWSSPR